MRGGEVKDTLNPHKLQGWFPSSSLGPAVQSEHLCSKPYLSVRNGPVLQGLEDVSEARPLLVALLASCVAVALCGQLLDEVIGHSPIAGIKQLWNGGE